MTVTDSPSATASAGTTVTTETPAVTTEIAGTTAAGGRRDPGAVAAVAGGARTITRLPKPQLAKPL